MKRIICILSAILILFMSCASKPKANTKVEKNQPKENETCAKEEISPIKHNSKSDEDVVVAKFGGVAITKKDKEIAKSEIENVVEKLNKITYQKNYPYWLKFLSREYKQKYSDPIFLEQVSSELPGSLKGLKLKNLQDYFNYVFVPSRQQREWRVDDIQYISPTKVKAVMVENGNRYLIIYNLEKINSRWLLVPIR